MSKNNKVNPGQYTQAGRLSPDDAARERRGTAAPAAERTGSGQKAVRTRPETKASQQPAKPAGRSKPAAEH
jgi:hypothetical protein